MCLALAIIIANLSGNEDFTRAFLKHEDELRFDLDS